jgi:hypothetical protein
VAWKEDERTTCKITFYFGRFCYLPSGVGP